MNNVDRLYEIAQGMAVRDPRFFAVKGPGLGNHATNRFIKTLRERSTKVFGQDFAERKICGNSALCVDYYFPHEATVVELAFGLHNPKTEFEKDVLKVIMAKEAGNAVSRLVFISKPGAKKKCAQPGRSDVIKWLLDTHKVSVEILELRARRG